MAEIDVQRRNSTVWPWLLLGLLVLGIVVWAVAQAFDDGEEEVRSAPVATAPAADVEVGVPQRIPVAQILQTPAGFVGQILNGEAQVVEVPTDRGFWIDDEGQRMFVIINETPGTAGEVIDINSGQTLQMSDATLYDARNLQAVTGELDADTRRIASEQQFVLGVSAQNVRIVQR